MLIRCPECNTGYNLTPAQIGKEGRTVRCIKCKHSWFQGPVQADTPPLAPETKPVATPKKKSKSSVEKSKSNMKKNLIISLFTTVVGLLILFALLILTQNTVVEKMPAMSGFYNAIGLGNSQDNDMISPTGLIIPPEAIERTLNEGTAQPTLTFNGIVKNTNTESVEVPEVRITLLDERGVEIDHWPAIVKKRILAPGEETTWICRFFDPPLDQISEHRVSFAQK